MRGLCLSLVAAGALALPARGGVGAATASGLYGVVVRGPVSPVCVAEKPCFRPLEGARLLFSRAGTQRHVTTDRLGRYRVGLAEGRYSVRVSLRGTALRARPTSVVVSSGRYARVGFSVDTGIR